MDATLPWDAWVRLVLPIYPDGKRGRPPQEIERMLRMTMLQTWFNLSDKGIEDAIYDSYAMKTFMRIDFSIGEQVPVLRFCSHSMGLIPLKLREINKKYPHSIKKLCTFSLKTAIKSVVTKGEAFGGLWASRRKI